MKKMITLACLFYSLNAFSIEGDSFDTSTKDGEVDSMSVEALGWSTNIKGEIMAFNPEGTRFLYSFNEKREWNFGGASKEMTNVWTLKVKGIPDLYLAHTWKLESDGSLSAKISQYESMKREGSSGTATPGKLIREETFKVQNLMPINWEFFKDKDKKLVVRFEPGVWADEVPVDLGRYPINGRNMVIYDSKNTVWAQRLRNTDGLNIFYGVETGKGSFFISLAPFKGAEEIGTIRRSTVQIKPKNGPKFRLQSDTPFVAEGVIGKVYGIVDFNRKMTDQKRVRTYGYDVEGPFQDKIVGK